jgi:hypothetical protein
MLEFREIVHEIVDRMKQVTGRILVTRYSLIISIGLQAGPELFISLVEFCYSPRSYPCTDI